MRALLCCTFVAVVAVTGVLLAQSAEKEDAMHGSAREKLIGAWHLVSMEEPGADGKVRRITNRSGVLIYTRDGHMSVQIMFPKSESGLSNHYVKDGYEASFGSYEVNEQSRMVTHHVRGRSLRDLWARTLHACTSFLTAM